MVEKNKRNRCHELEIVCEIKKGKLGKKKPVTRRESLTGKWRRQTSSGIVDVKKNKSLTGNWRKDHSIVAQERPDGKGKTR